MVLYAETVVLGRLGPDKRVLFVRLDGLMRV
jgi:hypothetical protein